MTDELLLIRRERRPDGVFSELRGPGDFVAAALEHAYETVPGSRVYVPKIPAGRFRCQRGLHRLHGMAGPFETFEITGVPGHTGLLFHCGNLNRDSEGCVLVGRSVTSAAACQMITQSRETFAALMSRLSGRSDFLISVLD